MTDATRPDGFYWARWRDDDEWFVAKWTGLTLNEFKACGSEISIDYEPDELIIGPQIMPPA